MAKKFIDVSLDQLEAEMRNSIMEGEVTTKIQEVDSASTPRRPRWKPLSSQKLAG